MDKKESVLSECRDCGLPPAPSAPPASQGTEGPVLYHDQEPPPYQPRQVPATPPKYALDPEYVKAKVGESPRLKFTVTSEPPLNPDTEHSLTHYDGKIATKRFKVLQDAIEFHDVRVSDTGFYTISCSNTSGLEGKATFELEVVQGQKCASSSAAAASLNPSRIGSLPTSPRFETFRTEQKRAEAKSTLKKYYTINVILIFLGPIFLCGLPFWISVIILYCFARRKYHKGDYAESNNLLGGAKSCCFGCVAASVAGVVIIPITLGLTLM